MSWTDELIRRRRMLTGESQQIATESVRPNLAALPAAELSRLRILTESPIVPAPYGPEAPVVWRATVLPDATDQSQIDLEAALLDAISRAVHHLHTHPEGSLNRPAVVVQSVTPLSDGLKLRLNPVAVAPLLYEAMPYEAEDALWGIPGLRAHTHRRSTELYLVDAPHTRVELLGVDKTAWRAAHAYRASRNRELEHGLCLADAAPDRLSPQEEKSLSAYVRAFGPAEMASGVLRRIGILNGTLWIQTWPTGCSSFNIEWPGHTPLRPSVSRALADPLFGLSAAEIATAPDLKFSHANRRCEHHGDLCSTHHLRFRFTELPSESDDSSISIGLKAGARPEWDAWSHALGAATVGA
ncbi:hypothetical protein [Amycolatopsis sp. NPDC003861]